jgi:hypothetical protein
MVWIVKSISGVGFLFWRTRRVAFACALRLLPGWLGSDIRKTRERGGERSVCERRKGDEKSEKGENGKRGGVKSNR